jgi:hypothetical protein
VKDLSGDNRGSAPTSSGATSSGSSGSSADTTWLRWLRALGESEWNYPASLCASLYRSADLCALFQRIAAQPFAVSATPRDSHAARCARTRTAAHRVAAPLCSVQIAIDSSGAVSVHADGAVAGEAGAHCDLCCGWCAANHPNTLEIVLNAALHASPPMTNTAGRGRPVPLANERPYSVAPRTATAVVVTVNRVQSRFANAVFPTAPDAAATDVDSLLALFMRQFGADSQASGATAQTAAAHGVAAAAGGQARAIDYDDSQYARSSFSSVHVPLFALRDSAHSATPK